MERRHPPRRGIHLADMVKRRQALLVFHVYRVGFDLDEMLEGDLEINRSQHGVFVAVEVQV
jgi:hypothetical protein